jgi:signal transduction histidine kinase
MRWPFWPAGLRWPLRRPGLHWSPTWVDAAWAVFALANLVAIVVFSHWETVPFHFIWISLTLLYGFRVWSIRPTAWVLAVVMITTFGAIGLDVWYGAQTVDELNEVPLMAAMFWMMVWHAQRRLAADTERDLAHEENARLLATQRRFLQDASHQLRTPITIALGHAELLASELAGRPEARDIQVVVGELDRLRRLGERLLMIAASEDPEFLRAEPVALAPFLLDLLRRWMPTSERRWQLGQLDGVVVSADPERLGLAVDAVLENAVRHTATGDVISMSVLAADGGKTARMIVADSGEGIAPAEFGRIFERFRTGTHGGVRGTGLGLALVRAVARAHNGEATVRSIPGQGSEFELLLPALPSGAGQGGPRGGEQSPQELEEGLRGAGASTGRPGDMVEDPWTGTR